MTPKLNDLAASAIRTELLRIADENNGVLNPTLVVEAARDSNNPLHAHFEWDDSAAAEAFRLAQAHGLIRRVKLTVMRPASDARRMTISSTRAFESRPSQRSRKGGYEPIDDILADEHKRQELVAQVLRDLRAYRRRYALLSELAAVWEAIDVHTTEEGNDNLPTGAPPLA